MPTAVPPHKKTTAYWNAQARWQQIWLEHNDYHREVIAFLTGKVQPGWRVLDIGAGNGILTLPLQRLGCRVTALEPSSGMRALLLGESRCVQAAPEKIDPRRWEEVPVGDLGDFDLILACNSLQLTVPGFQAALAKMFAWGPRHVCVVTEMGFPEIGVLSNDDAYRLSQTRYFLADSSYAYHHLHEAWEHLAHRLGRSPTAREKGEMQAKLVRAQNHLWLKGIAAVGIFWWTRERNKRGRTCSGTNGS
ncbi:MAG: methyltransferase domain-containing protein [Thermodesulfobacteriota bacterium]